jgi:hypothetical protein
MGHNHYEQITDLRQLVFLEYHYQSEYEQDQPVTDVAEHHSE